MKFSFCPRNNPWSPIDYEMLRIPLCLDNRLIDGDEVVSLRTGRALLPTSIIFLLLVLISV
jgi:hypothetical protein